MKRYAAILPCIFLASLFWIPDLTGQYSLITHNTDQRAAGMAQSGVVLNVAANALGNPAHLGFNQNFSAGVSGQPYIRISELNMFSLYSSIALSNRQSIGLTLSREGSKELNETMAGVAIGRRIAGHSAIGIGIHLLHRQLPESRSASGIIPEIGLQTALTRSISLGILIRNPIPVEIQKDVRFQSDYRAGILYKAANGLDLYLGMSKAGTRATLGSAGIEYSLKESFRLRLGARSNGSYALGLGILYKQSLYLDLAVDVHPQTGTIFGLGLQYRKNRGISISN